MNTENIKANELGYVKPEMDVLDIQVEGSILSASDTDNPTFDIVPGQTGAWD